MNVRLPRRSALLLGALLTAQAAPAATLWEVDVNVDMTEAGRKVAHPAPGKPAYYYPVVAGYREFGNAIAGQAPPPAFEVIRPLARALARQGYIASHGVQTDRRTRKGEVETLALSPRPSLILVFHWGCMNPIIIDETTVDGPPNHVVANQGEMLELVGGNTLANLDLNFEKEAVMQGIEQNRYFITVTAYDFDSYFDRHRKVLLWAAKLSIPSDGVSMDQVLPTLVAGGAPLFGRETRRPKWVMMPAVPSGHVVVGEPTLRQYGDAAPPPAAAAPHR